MLGPSFHRRPPARHDAIAKLERALGITLPADYVEFLNTSNGGEGVVGRAYLQLWRVEEIPPLNEKLKCDDEAASLLFFGSDGGGEAFAFDTSRSPWSVVMVDFISNYATDAKVAASCFTQFIERARHEGLDTIICPASVRRPPTPDAGTADATVRSPTRLALVARITDPALGEASADAIGVLHRDVLTALLDSLNASGPWLRQMSADGARLVLGVSGSLGFAEFHGSGSRSAIEAAVTAPAEGRPGLVFPSARAPISIPSQNCLPQDAIIRIAVDFFETGAPSPAVTWESIPTSLLGIQLGEEGATR